MLRPLPLGMIANITSKVTGRQLAFVREYFKDRNATQAAVRLDTHQKGHQLPAITF